MTCAESTYHTSLPFSSTTDIPLSRSPSCTRCHTTTDESNASVSPPAALAGRCRQHRTEEFGYFADAAAALQLDRPHTGAASKHMLKQSLYPEATQPSPHSRSKHSGSRRHSSSAGSAQDGMEAVTVPITAGIWRPPPTRGFISSVPPSNTEDAFAAALPKLPTSSNTSAPRGASGGTRGGEGSGATIASAGGVRSGSYATSSCVPAAGGGGRPPSQQSPASIFHYGNATPYPGEATPYGATSGFVQGRLPGVQPTLRGMATSTHPAVARKMMQAYKGPTTGGVGGGPNNTAYIRGSGSGLGYPCAPSHLLPRQESMRTSNGVGDAMSYGPYMPAPYPHTKPSVASIGHNGSDGSVGNGPSGVPYGALNGGGANNTSVNMLCGLPQTYGGGYPNTLAPTSSSRPGSVMGYSGQNGTGSMNYRVGGGGVGCLSGPGSSNNNSNSCSHPHYRSSGSGSSGDHMSALPPPSAFHPPGNQLGRMDYQRGGGSTYGSQRSGRQSGGATTRGGGVSGPRNVSLAASAQIYSQLQTAGTAPAFFSPSSPVQRPPPRQQSMTSFQSQTQSCASQSTREGELITQSINSGMLGVSDVQPVSQTKRKQQGPTVQREQEQSTAPSDWFTASASPLVLHRSQMVAFSAEESVCHEQRSTSWGAASGSPKISRMDSQRGNGVRLGGQRRLSDKDDPNNRGKANRGLLRRFADECGRLSRSATNGLRRNSTGEKRRRAKRACGDAEALSDDSTSRGSFHEDQNSSSDDEDDDNYSFNAPDDSSDKDREAQWSYRQSPEMREPRSAHSARDSTSSTSTVAQRRRVCVRPLDVSVIHLAVQERK